MSFIYNKKKISEKLFTIHIQGIESFGWALVYAGLRSEKREQGEFDGDEATGLLK